jgi:hypothetical protein
MKITDYIASTIDRLPKGYIFTYIDFIAGLNQKEAVIKALNRMAQTGKIAKLSKGKYYKPESTPFGTIRPNQSQVVKDLLEENGKTTGYLTGYSVYHELGLTTQVSNNIQIGKNAIRPAFKRERYTISFVRQKNTITKENIPLLQILDTIRYIKKIPDTTPESSTRRFLAILKDLPESSLSTMVRLAKKYPPATRAFLGALLDALKNDKLANLLLSTLNPITTYHLPGVGKALPTAEKWNIV